MDNDTFSLAAIGLVENTVSETTDLNWSDVISTIRIKDEYTGGTEGLEGFSHILVVYLLHKASHSNAELLRRPRGRADMPLVGIFAQRAKDRPNPIGVTAVRLVAVDGNVLTVRGLDAIDNTPVLDIKPYVRQFDRIDGATQPAWIDILMQDYF